MRNKDTQKWGVTNTALFSAAEITSHELLRANPWDPAGPMSLNCSHVDAHELCHQEGGCMYSMCKICCHNGGGCGRLRREEIT